MVILYKYGPAWSQPDLSPFCFKVETYFRMVGVDYESAIGDVRKAPKQKLPYVDDGGVLVSDSRDIIEHFEAKQNAPLDQGMTARERAAATAFRALLEEEAYFYCYYLRWQAEDGWRTYWPRMKQYGLAVGVPSWLASFVFKGVRKKALRAIWGQGTGRHSREEVETRLVRVLEAVSDQLGDGPYFLGEKPRVIDATVYAYMSQLLGTPFPGRAQEIAQSSENVRLYCARMQRRYFAEYGGSGAAAGTSVAAGSSAAVASAV